MLDATMSMSWPPPTSSETLNSEFSGEGPEEPRLVAEENQRDQGGTSTAEMLADAVPSNPEATLSEPARETSPAVQRWLLGLCTTSTMDEMQMETKYK